MSQSDDLDAEILAEARAESSTPASRAGADDAVEADQDLARGDSAEQPAPSGSLWRDRNFLTMWSGQAFSQFGAQITELAVPVLAVLLLNASEFEVGVLTAANVAAFLIVGLPAGAWIDRMRKRHVMIWADAVRAVALGTVPLLWMLGMLQIWHLVAVSLIMGVATVFFDVSYQSLIPSLVRSRQIAEANGKLESTQQIAGLTGPAVGGWLIGAITAPLAIVVTVGTYVVSLVALIFTRDHEVRRAPEDHQPILTEIGEGLRWVFGNPLLRRIVATTGFANLFSTLSFTLLPIYLLRILEFTPAQMGIVFSLGAVGGLLGAIATPRIVKRFGEARTLPISVIGFSVAPLLLPVATLVPSIAFPFLVVQSFLTSFTVLLYNITQVTFRQRITPPRLLGRMNASIRFCVWGVMPIAALIAGALGTWIGVVPTLWIAAVLELFAGLFIIIGPFWNMRDLPDADTDAGARATEHSGAAD
ncbi:MFS transporter [uncultured Microbacterium sp.]|uniref:MFS transporter n=1 Tax=uncultured Microbacterium sp. TaxID=191216 RepID=UPI0028D781D3|nr:MFS transporter [uncultured Microbacterium sp.]